MDKYKEKNLGFKKQINISKRGYKIIYLDKSKIYVNNSTIVYSSKSEIEEKTFNIPYLNTSIIMLGPGTSISNEAVRLAAENSLIIMFVNSLNKISSSTDSSFNILSPTSEYKPTEYMQKMANIFFNEEKKLEKAKEILLKRIRITKNLYNLFIKDNIITNSILKSTEEEMLIFNVEINESKSIQNLLLSEARYTKKIYKIFATEYNIDFKRDQKEYNKRESLTKNDINKNLTHINYFCYALSASMLSTLGVSFAFPLLHGKTRRGALVFDIADLIKDGFSIPLAFYFNTLLYTDKEVRINSFELIEQHKIFDLLFKEFQDLLK